jgi:3-oxoacid CoA-transferase A subunit
MKNKIFATPDEAIADVPDGATIMFGGFGGAGFPNNLIQALDRKGTRGIHAISNNCGTGDAELGLMFKHERIRSVVATFPGPQSHYFQEQLAAGTVDLELSPQGIFCERIRAQGAAVRAFYTPVGVATEIAEGKEERIIDGKRCILEKALRADYAFIRAHLADEIGNLIYRKTARNFNPIMAMAGKITIVEVDEIVPVGTLDPETIVTPSIFVNRIVQAEEIRND